MPSIAAIIVNYGTADQAFAAVKSVFARRNPGCTVTVHLVDNGSPDEDLRRLKQLAKNNPAAPNTQLHLLSNNCGFGAGNNAVLEFLATQSTPPDYVLFLNPDAVLASEAISILANFLEEHPDAAFAGAQIRLPDRTTLRPSAFPFPNLVRTLAGAADLPLLYRLLSQRTASYPPMSRAYRVDWVSAAAMLAPFDRLQDLGFFDPGYFLYYEEVDLIRRAAQRGWECWHVPGAEAYHEEGGATGFSRVVKTRQRWPSHWYASSGRYFQMNHGRPYSIAVAGLWVLGDLLNRIASPLTGRPRTTPLHFYSDLWSYGLRPLLGFNPKRAELQDSAPQ